MLILGIESSCDDSAIALVANGKKVIFNEIASQHQDHHKHQGVIPELAARKHLTNFTVLLENLLRQKKIKPSEIDYLAVTYKPGLNGSLLMGITFAKSLSLILNKPLIGVNHLKAHFYSLLMETKIKLPFLGLLISGGHTLLVLVVTPLEIKIIGSTLDDACGECLDKIAKYYNLGYPGGPFIEKLAKSGDENFFDFPIPQTRKNPFSFSFSGLKTAIIHHKKKYQNPLKKSPLKKEHLAASVQKAVFTYLYRQVQKAVKKYKIKEVGICGGVAANRYLREIFSKTKTINAYFPSLPLCVDNGAMVAGLAFEYATKRKINAFAHLQTNPLNYKNKKVL